MSKPFIHAKSSARKFGGKPEDYEEIHTFLDSSKSAFPTNAHRCLTHNAWFLFVLERIKFHNSGPCTPDNRFPMIINSDGREVSVRDIGEVHILEDYNGKFIPSAADFLNEIEFKPWMQNGEGYPPSFEKVYKKKEEKIGQKEVINNDPHGMWPIPKEQHKIFEPSGISPNANIVIDGSNLVADGSTKFRDQLLKEKLKD